MSVAETRRTARLKRQRRVRRKVVGTADQPRLCVFRSAKNIYAQIIEDQTGTTLVSVSTLSKDVLEAGTHGGNIEAAKAIGKAIAEKAIANNIKKVVFDRNGFLYHGRIKALADAAREAGLSF